MSQTAAVENEICSACGVKVRPQADYCYNCGAAVSVVAVAKKSPPISAVNLPADDENSGRETIDTKFTKVKTTIVAAEKQTTPELTKLKSAASLRRESKSIERKTVEIVWDEHENAPNALFIAIAVILTLVAAGILFLAFHLK